MAANTCSWIKKDLVATFGICDLNNLAFVWRRSIPADLPPSLADHLGLVKFPLAPKVNGF